VERRRTVIMAALGIAGGVVLLLCGLWAAAMGLLASLNNELWRADMREASLWSLVALAMIVAAILWIKRSIRRLRYDNRSPQS